jgi:hypothetical protein
VVKLGLFKKVFQKRVLRRLFVERFNEPLHLNILSLFIFIFGNFKSKIYFDLILRQHNAYSILSCAEVAKKMGINKVTLIEFGVASGSGLVNMAKIAGKVSQRTGVLFKIYGFDTGEGLTDPKGFKDYPSAFKKGDYPTNIELLKKKLPKNVELVLGDVKDTIEPFLKNFDATYPIGYIVLDLDLFSSSLCALAVLKGKSESYYPTLHLYADDIDEFGHSVYCGEEAAISKFNSTNSMVKIERNVFLKNERVFRKQKWLDKMFKVQVFEHPMKQAKERSFVKNLNNPYL